MSNRFKRILAVAKRTSAQRMLAIMLAAVMAVGIGFPASVWARAAEVITVTFNTTDTNFGSAPTPTPMTVVPGGSITLPTLPEYIDGVCGIEDNTPCTGSFFGYSFNGWYDGESRVGRGGDIYTPSSNITLNARWGGEGGVSLLNHLYGLEPGQEPGITFNANGGTASPTSINVDKGSSVATPTPSKSYTLTYNVNGGNVLSPSSKNAPCICNGWFTAKGTKRANAGESFIKNNDHYQILYAQWTNPAMGTLPTPTHPTSGYTFKGWFTAASGGTQVTSSTVMTGNQTIYAQWNVPAATTYTVSYNANGGTGTTASSSHTYGVAKNLTSNGFSKTGYTFAGWATSATGPVVYSDGQSVINLTSTNGATVPLYAVWTAIPTTTYTITYNANGGSVSPANATVNVGSAVTTPTPTKSYTLTYSVNGGYALPSNTKIVSCTCNGWFTAASGGMKRANAGESYTPEQTETIYAQWTNPAMGALPTPSHPTPGYSFKGWFTAATGGTQVTSATAMMGNQTIYAQWNAPDSNKPSAGPLSTNERYGFVNSHRDFFGHSATEDGCKKVMTDSDFNKLADYAWKLYPGAAQSVVNAMQDDRNKNWGGSCYGMAVTSILDKQGKVDIKKNYGTNKVNLRDVSAPYLNAAARSAINYYQNSWELSKLWVGTGYNKNNGSTQWASGVKQMVDAAKEGNLPMLLCYYWYNANGGTSGHAIVVNGYSQNANGSHRLICYDNRYPTRDFIVTVSSNYSSVITELSEDAFLIYAQTDFDNYDRIDIDGPNNDFVLTAPSAAPAVQGATLSFPASSVVSITNSEGKTLRYNSATGTYTGDMQVISEYLLPNATVDGQATAATISLVVPESNSFTFTSSDSGVDASVISKDIYASGYSDQADEIAITKGKGIEITGKGSFDFTASLGINTTVMDMIKIEGRTDGDATLLFHSGGALVDGQSGNATLTVFSETTYASSHDINNTYGSAVIKDDGSGTPGKIEMLVDSNGDGTYDKNLLATSTKGIFGTNAKWYGAWWHYVLFFIGFGFIWMW